MSVLSFFQAIAPGDELAIANRMKDIALAEIQFYPTNGDAAKFVSMFLLAQWIERSTKIVLTYYRRDVATNKDPLRRANVKQGHRIVDPLWEVWRLGEAKSIGPGIWPQAKAVLENDDVRKLLGFVERVADASLGRYSNLDLQARGETNVAFMSELGQILTDAATVRLGIDACSLDGGDFAVVAEHAYRFIRSVVDVVVFILHFPVGQGVCGALARQELAGRFFPVPPDRSVFAYLINE